MPPDRSRAHQEIVDDPAGVPEGVAPALPCAWAEEPAGVRRRRHRRQWAALLFGIAAAAVLVTLQLRAVRDGIRAEQEDRLRQQARLLEQQLARQVAAVDAGLRTVLADLPGWAAHADWAAFGLRLKALDSAVIATRTILLLDVRGHVVASSRPELLGVDASARPFFQLLRAAPDAGQRLFVSAPYRTQLGVWAFNVSRAVIGPDGRFAGAVTATLDPEWLSVTLATVNYAADMWAALAHAEGRLVQMVPLPPQPVDGVDLARPGTMFTRHRESGRQESVLTGRIAATAQARRLIAQRTVLPELPLDSRLVLALSRDIDAVLAGWRQQAWAAGTFVVLLAGLGALGLWQVQRDERRASAAALAARQALQAQERRWALALASMGLGVWDRDLCSGREYGSALCRRLLGLADDDALGSWQERLHPDDAAAVQQRLDGHLAGQADVFEARCRLRAGDGGWRQVRVGGLVVERGSDGGALRIVGTLLDETDRAQAEALRLERDRAEAASKAKSEFMSRMSHEMRTPLNAVLGFAQLLRVRAGETDAEQLRRYAELIEQGGRHLLALVEDVLDLSRIEGGRLDLALQPQRLAPLLAQALALVSPLADGAGVTLRLQPPPADTAAVLADALRLNQVLHNLLGNAIKYNRRGGTVELRWRSEAAPADAPAPGRPGWRIEVQDTGPGLDETQLAHLFEPFNRLGYTNSAIAGTGLGLVLTRWFVERMGGRIDVRSRPGEGSVFSVWLPAP